MKSKEKDILKAERRRQTPSGKVKETPRRLSDLVRKNGRAILPGQDTVSSTDGRLERRMPPSNEASVGSAVIKQRGALKRQQAKDLDPPEQVFQKAVDTIQGILKAVRADSPFSVSSAEAVAEVLIHHLETSDSLLAPVFATGNPSPDPPREAVHVCILAVKFALELGYTRDQLRQLSLAALLHDVGMSRLPEGLVEKKGPLNPIERASLARHSEEGAQIIQRLGPEYTWLAEVVLQVHERVDGSGYPNALRGIEVQEYAQIIGLADVYESLVHDRPHRPPVEALKEILRRERAGFPDRILKALIKALSPYPLGSLVRLNTGEIGRVVARNKSRPLRPVVEVLVRGGKQMEQPVVIDLSQSPLLHVQDSVLEESLS